MLATFSGNLSCVLLTALSKARAWPLAGHQSLHSSSFRPSFRSMGRGSFPPYVGRGTQTRAGIAIPPPPPAPFPVPPSLFPALSALPHPPAPIVPFIIPPPPLPNSQRSALSLLFTAYILPFLSLLSFPIFRSLFCFVRPNLFFSFKHDTGLRLRSFVCVFAVVLCTLKSLEMATWRRIMGR